MINLTKEMFTDFQNASNGTDQEIFSLIEKYHLLEQDFHIANSNGSNNLSDAVMTATMTSTEDDDLFFHSLNISFYILDGEDCDNQGIYTAERLAPIEVG